MPTVESPVRVEHRDGISYVVIDRPERMNALSSAGWLVFEQRMIEADAEPATGAIIVTGAGRAFSAGGDVSSMSDRAEADASMAPVHTRRVRHDGIRFVDTMLQIEKPTVAMVNGAAVGLGATVALLCDSVVMATTARIGDSHVPLGIVAGDGAVAVLPLLIGMHRTKELLITGRLVSGEEAAAMGIVSEAVPPDELDAAARRKALELSANPAYAVRATKLLVNRLLRFSAGIQLETAFAYEHISRDLPEHKEALARFRARRR